MKVSKLKSWARLVLIYWLFMSALFYLEFRYMESDWAGLPGFIFTLPLSAFVVAIGLLPAVVGRYGHEIPLNMSSYDFEYGFIGCAFLNAFILYPFYRLWANRKRAKNFEPPPPPNHSFNLPR